jgi:hypothetical protein
VFLILDSAIGAPPFLVRPRSLLRLTLPGRYKERSNTDFYIPRDKDPVLRPRINRLPSGSSLD